MSPRNAPARLVTSRAALEWGGLPSPRAPEAPSVTARARACLPAPAGTPALGHRLLPWGEGAGSRREAGASSNREVLGRPDFADVAENPEEYLFADPRSRWEPSFPARSFCFGNNA